MPYNVIEDCPTAIPVIRRVARWKSKDPVWDRSVGGVHGSVDPADGFGRLSSPAVGTARAEQGIDVLLNGRPVEPGVLPQPLGNRTASMPADFHHADLVAVPVNGPMVGAAERNGEFIADPAPHGSRLHEPQMVSVAKVAVRTEGMVATPRTPDGRDRDSGAVR